MKNFGFTLAEVLITLSIIGIVAAMTTPALITKYKKHVAEVKLQKFYSVINNTMKLIQNDYGDITEDARFYPNVDSLFETDFYYKYFTPYMENVSVQKTVPSTINSDAYIKFIDGSGFRAENRHKELRIVYYLDINKKFVKKDNTQMPYFFEYKAQNNQIIPYGLSLYNSIWYGENYVKQNCYRGTYVYHCAVVIFANGWKFPKDFPRVTTGSNRYIAY